MLNESVRIDMNTLEISLSADCFLGNVFGKPMSRKRGTMSQKNWEKILKRITSSLRESIAKNLNSDEFHKWRINLYLDQLDEACESEHNTDPEFILSITGLIFELLGGTRMGVGPQEHHDIMDKSFKKWVK